MVRVCRFCISAYPGVQERVIAELDEAGLLLTAARPEPRELKQDDLKDLVVLEAVRLPVLLSAGLAGHF